MAIKAAETSGLQTGDAAILAKPGWLTGVTLNCEADGGVILYDHASAASGDVLEKLFCDVSLEMDDLASKHVSYNPPIACKLGIYADVSGTGNTYIVHYITGIS